MLVGESGGFTKTQIQRTNSRSDNRCFDTQHYVAMRQTRKVYCPVPSQAACKFWEAWHVN